MRIAIWGLGLGLLIGCGGQATGTGSSPQGEPIPRKNGLPIGDCHDPTPADQAWAHCPVEQPEPGSACSVPDAVCHYAIQTDGSSSFQPVFHCLGGNWGVGRMARCGSSCGAAGGRAVGIAGECSARAESTCERIDPQPILPLTDQTAQELLDDIVQQTINPCLTGPFVENAFEVGFRDGCAVSWGALTAPDAETQACITRAFAAHHFSCAESLECGFGGRIFLSPQ